MNSADIATELEQVIDPELGINIVSLGLIYRIAVTDESVRVDLTMTTPNCPMAEAIASMAASRISRVAEGREVRLALINDPEWSIGMLDAGGRAQLGLPPV